MKKADKPGSQVSLKEQFSIFLINRAYAPRTVKRYTAAVSHFMEFSGFKIPSKGSTAEIERFNREVFLNTGRSQASQSEHLHALRIFLNEFLKKNILFSNLGKPRKKKVQPVSVTRSDLEVLYRCANSLKKKLMIILVGSLKLKINEVLELKKDDVDIEREALKIKHKQNSGDRLVPVFPVMLRLLQNYLNQHKPVYYLFEASPGKRNSARSAQLVLEEAVEKSELKKRITYATLRKSTDVFIPDYPEGSSAVKFFP